MGKQLTMESFDLFEKPFKPAPIKAQVGKFLESAPLIDAWVERELSTFDHRKDDGILEADKYAPDAIETEGVFTSHKVLLHDGQPIVSVMVAG